MRGRDVLVPGARGARPTGRAPTWRASRHARPGRAVTRADAGRPAARGGRAWRRRGDGARGAGALRAPGGATGPSTPVYTQAPSYALPGRFRARGAGPRRTRSNAGPSSDAACGRTTPKWPNRPRWRLKRATVTQLARECFDRRAAGPAGRGQAGRLKRLPSDPVSYEDVGRLCREVRRRYVGRTVAQVAAAVGSGRDSSDKPEVVNGIRMYRQSFWLRGRGVGSAMLFGQPTQSANGETCRRRPSESPSSLRASAGSAWGSRATTTPRGPTGACPPPGRSRRSGPTSGSRPEPSPSSSRPAATASASARAPSSTRTSTRSSPSSIAARGTSPTSTWSSAASRARTTPSPSPSRSPAGLRARRASCGGTSMTSCA